MRNRWLELVLIFAIALAIALAADSTCNGQEQTAAGEELKAWPIADYSGGVDHVLPKNQLPGNQFLSLQNFFIRGGKLECRKGWQPFGDTKSSLLVDYIQVFRPRSGGDYLFTATNKDLWYQDYPNGDTVRISWGEISGTASVTASSRQVSCDGAAGKWMTYLGTGEGAAITFENGDSSATYEVQYIITDSSLHLTADAGSTWTSDTYTLTARNFDVKGMIPFNDILWIYTTLGRTDFYGPDSIVSEALTGTRYRGFEDAVWLSSGVHYYRVYVGAGDNNAPTIGNNWWLRAVTGCKVDTSSAIGTPDDIVAMTYPVAFGSDQANHVTCYGGGLEIDFSDDDSFTVFKAAYDSSDNFTTLVDSVVVRQDAGWPTSLEIFCDTCWWIANDTAFVEGDWFVALAENGVHKTTFPCFPVIHNTAFDGDSAIALYCADERDTNSYGSEGDTATVIFYRIKRNTGASAGATNYNWATLYDDRVFYNRQDDPMFVYQSQAQFPESLSSAVGFYVRTHDGDRPMAALGQGEVLKIYCENSRHAVTSNDGYLYYINELSKGVGVSAPRSLCEHNGIHFYLHRSGVYADDGSNQSIAQPISWPINDWFTDSIAAADYDDVRGVIYDNKYWICIPLNSGGYQTFVFDLLSQAWTNVEGLEFVSTATDLVADDTLRFLFGDPDSGMVAAYQGGTDGNDKITATVETGYLDMDSPELDKIFRQVRWGWDKCEADSVTLDCYPDTFSTSLWHLSLATPASFGHYRANPMIDIHGPMVKLKLSVYDATKYRHGYLKVDYVVKSMAF